MSRVTAEAESAPGSSDAIHEDPDVGLEGEVLDRLRQVLRERGATRDLLQMPQAMSPFEGREVEALEYFPWKRMVGSTGELPLKDLLQAPANAFVSRCYRLLLGREPTPEEMQRNDARASGSLRRLWFVSSLRLTGEGRRAGVRLTNVVPRLGPALWSSVARIAKPLRKRK
jgi:hypothetical protein